MLTRGPDAAVYRAHLPDSGRAVVVTIGDGPPADPAGFSRDLPAAQRVSAHPQIVTVYAGGIIGSGRPYLVTAVAAGPTFAARMAESGPLPTPEVLDAGFEIADALVDAHGEGLLHSGLRPENLVLLADGSAALAGLGLAAMSPVAAPLWLEPANAGYAAPELTEGAEPSVLTDVYAVGATLYALLIGRAPPSGPDPLPDPGLPGAAGLMEVIWRATAVDPRQRYQSAGALRDALAAVRAGRPRAAHGLRPLMFRDADAEGRQVARPSGSAAADLPTPGRTGSGGSPPPAAPPTPPTPATPGRQVVLLAVAALAVLLVVLALVLL